MSSCPNENGRCDGSEDENVHMLLIIILLDVVLTTFVLVFIPTSLSIMTTNGDVRESETFPILPEHHPVPDRIYFFSNLI